MKKIAISIAVLLLAAKGCTSIVSEEKADTPQPVPSVEVTRTQTKYQTVTKEVVRVPESCKKLRALQTRQSEIAHKMINSPSIAKEINDKTQKAIAEKDLKALNNLSDQIDKHKSAGIPSVEELAEVEYEMNKYMTLCEEGRDS